MLIRGFIFGLSLLLASVSANAAGYTDWAIPTQLEYVNGGVLVTGNFGLANSSCTKTNYIFVPDDTSDGKAFKAILSMILTAFASQKEMKFNSNSCKRVTFHWTDDTASQTHTWHAVFVR